MSKAKTKTKQPVSQRTLVVYGYDENQKPRAAQFVENEFELARKAAELMKLQVYEGEAIKLRRALKKISAGNVYASGWGFVPNIRQSQYDALLTKLTGTKPPMPGALVPTGYPKTFDEIEIGHLVIAPADSAADGWWPSIVTGIDGDMLSLQMRDYPKEKGKRHRTAVALVSPPVT
jgi:hypothetical protein